MRLFVAVTLAPEVEHRVTELVSGLRERAVRLAPRARITWASAGRLHVTLAFFGEVDPDRARELTARLEPPLPVATFAVEVAGLGAFPPKGPPRVIWAGIEHGRDHMVALAAHVARHLADLGLRQEDRPFHPHLTLARVREPAGLRTAALLEGVAAVRLGTSAVEAITLFESRLSPRGSTYVVLRQTRLGGPRVEG